MKDKVLTCGGGACFIWGGCGVGWWWGGWVCGVGVVVCVWGFGGGGVGGGGGFFALF